MSMQKQIFGETEVWFVVTPLIYFYKESSSAEETGKYVCYFNFQPPGLILGELIRDENSKPFIFDNSTDAISFATELVKKKFSLKE